ncbi:unnamed protein product [Amaranthus hypochondriacus]
MVRFRKPNLLFIVEFMFFWWVLLRFGSTFVLVVGQQQQRVTLPSERIALIQLRSSLGLRARDWPIKPDPCTFWRGIQCNNNGSVIGINISGFRRTRFGVLNPQFAVDSIEAIHNTTRRSTTIEQLNPSTASFPSISSSTKDWLSSVRKKSNPKPLQSDSDQSLVGPPLPPSKDEDDGELIGPPPPPVGLDSVDFRMGFFTFFFKFCPLKSYYMILVWIMMINLMVWNKSQRVKKA